MFGKVRAFASLRFGLLMYWSFGLFLRFRICSVVMLRCFLVFVTLGLSCLFVPRRCSCPVALACYKGTHEGTSRNPYGCLNDCVSCVGRLPSFQVSFGVLSSGLLRFSSQTGPSSTCRTPQASHRKIPIHPFIGESWDLVRLSK